MDVMTRIENCGVIPAAAIEQPEHAVPTANALLAGGVDVIEITFRTEKALEAMKHIRQDCPDVCLGAGTVLTLEQCEAAAKAGAEFLVAPGFDEKISLWCEKNQIPLIPGCVTPTEITNALRFGIHTVKYFPADVYSCLPAMKALSGPFPTLRFIPTGGVNNRNLAEYTAAPYVPAVGGSWLCTKANITAENFSEITQLSSEARKILLGFEFAHLGINTENTRAGLALAESLHEIFGFELTEGASSVFASSAIEVMKKPYLGKSGHVAIKTAHMKRAVAALAKKGYRVDESTAKYKDEKMVAVYLEKELGGFAVHLLQR